MTPTPEERVAAWIDSPRGMDALQHACADPSAAGEQVVAMIREAEQAAAAAEREACAMVAHYELGATQAETTQVGKVTRERATAVKIRDAILARGAP